MKRCPAPWAIMVCEIWLVSMILTLCWGILDGAPVAVASYPFTIGASLVTLVFIERTVLLQRWSYIVLALLATFLAGGSWFSFLVGITTSNWLFFAVIHTVASIALWCCVFAKKSGEEERNQCRRLALRTSLVSGGVALLVAAALFYQSFQAPSSEGERIAKRSELTGLWYGTQPSSSPHIQPYVLTLMSDGTGNFRRYKTVHDEGFPVQWLLRGGCLHLSIARQSNRRFCPVLSDDAHALYLGPTSLKGVGNFKREPYNVITGTGE